VEEEQDDTEDEPEMEYEHRNVTEHPYCTNWPVVKEKRKNENL
jgi:hypothetical protein